MNICIYLKHLFRWNLLFVLWTLSCILNLQVVFFWGAILVCLASFLSRTLSPRDLQFFIAVCIMPVVSLTISARDILFYLSFLRYRSVSTAVSLSYIHLTYFIFLLSFWLSPLLYILNYCVSISMILSSFFGDSSTLIWSRTQIQILQCDKFFERTSFLNYYKLSFKIHTDL